MSVSVNLLSSASDPEENVDSTLSHDTSVVSSSSSSSSMLKAPIPTRNYTGSGSSSPNYGSLSRPPAWLSRRFRQDSAEPSGDHVPTAKPIPSPSPSIGARHRMSSPEDFEFGEELGGGSWSTVHLSLVTPYRSCSSCISFPGCGSCVPAHIQAICHQDTEQGPTHEGKDVAICHRRKERLGHSQFWESPRDCPSVLCLP